jgi:xanthine dehydrogenase accessory factor
MQRFYERLAQLIRKHRRVAVATVVDTGGSHPREMGAKMIVLPDGTGVGTIGGGKVEQLVMDDSLKGMDAGEPFTKHYNLLPEDMGGVGMECGGDVMVFFEYPRAPETLLLCGAGHIASALAPMAARADFSVVVVDPRGDFALAERFPDAAAVHRMGMDDPALMELVDGDTYAVVITHAHANDKQAVANLLQARPKYLGMIGSLRKVRTLMGQLKEEGADAEALANVYAPIGLDIGAETPGEIAASILAELINVRRTMGPSKLSMREVVKGIDADA